MTSSSRHLTKKDLAEMLVGAVALAFPVALTDEAWTMGEQLSWFRILLLLIASWAILGWFGLHVFHGGDLRANWRSFVVRICVVYLLTAALSTLLLIVLDKWPIMSDPEIALRRTIIVSFPAVFSATIVDSLR